MAQLRSQHWHVRAQLSTRNGAVSLSRPVTTWETPSPRVLQVRGGLPSCCLSVHHIYWGKCRLSQAAPGLCFVTHGIHSFSSPSVNPMRPVPLGVEGGPPAPRAAVSQLLSHRAPPLSPCALGWRQVGRWAPTYLCLLDGINTFVQLQELPTPLGEPSFQVSISPAGC